MKNLKIEEQRSGSEPHAHGEKARGTVADRPQPPTGTSSQRQDLMAVLEECGVSAAAFEALRSDTYEKRIAAESVENLGRLYEALLDPALGLAEVRERCPVWPVGSKYAGKLPSLMTLRDIKERVLLDWQIKERLSHDDSLKRLDAASTLSEEEYFRAAMRMLGAELFSAKLDGKPISDNLRVFDRMLRVWAMLTKLKHQTRRQELSARTMALRNEKPDERGAAEAAAGKTPKSHSPAPVGVTPAATGKKESPKSNLPAQSKSGNGLPNLVPSLDLSLEGKHCLSGKGYDATVKSVAEEILAAMTPAGPN